MNRLTRKGCVRKKRHPYRCLSLEVLLPREVLRGLDLQTLTARLCPSRAAAKLPAVRRAILRRERGRCFYCATRLRRGLLWFDHVIPLSEGGPRNEQNLVACCKFCNQQKGMGPARAFLKEMLLLKRLTPQQHRRRLAVVMRIQRNEPILPFVLRGRTLVFARPLAAPK